MNEMITNYPNATEVIKSFYLEKLISSIKMHDEIPEEFKEFARQKGMDDENIVLMMKANPRNLFDVFDQYEIYVDVTIVNGEGGFKWRINGSDWSSVYKTRFDAETSAVMKAYELLENKLNDNAGV